MNSLFKKVVSVSITDANTASNVNKCRKLKCSMSGNLQLSGAIVEHVT